MSRKRRYIPHGVRGTIAGGIFLTGNKYDKLALFCRFLGLELISKATYNRMQTHYIIPEVQRYWEQMKNEIWDILSGESVILCGEMTPQGLVQSTACMPRWSNTLTSLLMLK